MLPTRVLYYGRDEPLPDQIPLRAGPLALVYENGDLRYIRLGPREIVRRIYVAVRDHNWGTVAPALSDVRIEAADGSFRVTYSVTNRQGGIDFCWRGEIAGGSDGTIRFTMDGQARSMFLRNRIGFCVLHPIRECAGAHARIEHVDGSVEESVFPQDVAPQSIAGGSIQPHHPFSEMRAVAHEIAPGRWAEVRFEGETFEMEDQRNWIDVSYKTYGTPLRLPFPVEIEAGARVAQAVTLTLRGEGRAVEPADLSPDAQPLSFTLQPASFAGKLPRIGLGCASHGGQLTERELERLKALNLAHLRVDLHLGQSDYITALRHADAEARALGVPLETALHLSDAAESELRALMGVLGDLGPEVCAWLVFHVAEQSTSERWLSLARAHLSACEPGARIGGGTNANFAELNRARPPAEALDLVGYSINPQVHATDNASLVEACAGIAATVQTARQFASGRPIAVTPVTLKPRFNPVATAAEPEPAPDELPPQVDVRQMSLFGAGWTLGSLKYLAESGAASATFYETTGWRGVMETEAGPPLPEAFRSIPGAVFPLYHVLADAGELAGALVIPAASSDPLSVDGLALYREGRARVLIASFSPEPQRVMVRGLGADVRVRVLDETNAEDAMRAPEAFRAQPGETCVTAGGSLTLSLRPYAIARIDTSF